MFCRNCGKEIKDSAAFCPECGTRVVSVSKAPVKIEDERLRKIVGICAAFTVLVVIVTFVVKIHGHMAAIPSEEEIRAAANNLQNGGIIASDGKWLYYNDSGLCKERLSDGKKQSVISGNIEPEEMFFVGDSLYYYTLSGYRKIHGKSNIGADLGYGVFTEQCLQTDGKNYYVTGFGNYEDGGIYTAKVKNTEKHSKISDIFPTCLLLNGDYLYAISGYGTINGEENRNYGTWRMDKDGKNQILLLNFCPRYMVFSDDTIYYTDEDNALCSMRLDGLEKRVYDETYVGNGLNVSEDYVFYVNKDTGTIWRMNKDGSRKTELNQNRSEDINIAGTWLFYKNRDDEGKIYKMGIAGNSNRPLLLKNED